MNPLVAGAADYHRATSYQRHRLTPHTLDWANQPVLVKRYPEAERLPLDGDVDLPAVDYADLVELARGPAPPPAAALDRRTLSALLRLTHAPTARSLHGGQPFYYRSVASAGALYPFELYLAVRRIEGIDPGVYHYDLFDLALTALRRGALPDVPPSDREVAATVFIGGIFFRSAWKYRSRAYRYVLLDAGHLLENLRLALSSLGVAFSVHLDFDDRQADRLLGLDAQREACLACIHLHGDGRSTPQPMEDPAPLGEDIALASRVSAKEVAYPAIERVHRAGCARGAGASLPRPAAIDGIGRSAQAWQAPAGGDPSDTPAYAQVLWQRRSRRNFIPTGLSDRRLATFLKLIAASAGAEPAATPASVLTTALLVGAGMSTAPGFYRFDPRTGRLGLLSGGRLTASMAAACLDQMWLQHAALHVLFLSDPTALDRSWGARGYRYAMIEAGRLGQQAYLAATALGLGACGIGAIYDEEAAALLDLAGDGALLYLVGVGAVKSR